MFVILLALILAIYLIYQIFFENHRMKELAKTIPGPPLWPVIGNLPLFLTNDIRFSDLMQKNYEQYGDRFRFLIGNELIFVTSNAKDVEAVIASTSDKPDDYNLLKYYLGNSIFLNNGENAKKKRKILVPAFHADVLSNHTHILEDALNRFMRKLEPLVHDDVDICHLTQIFTLDVLSESSMGVTVNAMENENSDFVVAFRKLLDTWDIRWKNIFYHSDIIYFASSAGRTEKSAVRILHKFCENIIAKRKIVHENELEFIDGKKVSFLDALLRATDENGQKLDDDTIKYEVAAVLIAGHDTTYATFSMLSYLVALHQDIQQKLYKEQVDIMGYDRNKMPSLENVQNMKYLDKVIKETFRLYMIVPTIGRKSIKDIHLDGLTLPKGCNIWFNMFNMGRNPKVFPDPLKFDPERWSPDEMAKRSQYTSIPFSIGPRSCIGQSFATWELKCLFSRMIRNFNFTPSEKKLELVFAITIKPVNGLFLKLVKRR